MNPITTANKLKTLRTLKGLSPEQVAEKASLNLSDYEALELGKTAVSEEKLTKVCNALGVDAKEWFETDDSKVAINNGEISGNNSQQQLNCENCYFYNRTDEDAEILKTMADALKVMSTKLNDEVLIKQIEKVLRQDALERKKKSE